MLRVVRRTISRDFWICHVVRRRDPFPAVQSDWARLVQASLGAPSLLDISPPALGLEPPLLGRQRRARRTPWLRALRRLPDQLDEARLRVLAIALLGAEALGRDDDARRHWSAAGRQAAPVVSRTSSGRLGEWRTSKRNCTAVETLWTFCPPGPDARIKLSCSSSSSIDREVGHLNHAASRRTSGGRIPASLVNSPIAGLSASCTSGIARPAHARLKSAFENRAVRFEIPAPHVSGFRQPHSHLPDHRDWLALPHHELRRRPAMGRAGAHHLHDLLSRRSSSTPFRGPTLRVSRSLGVGGALIGRDPHRRSHHACAPAGSGAPRTGSTARASRRSFKARRAGTLSSALSVAGSLFGQRGVALIAVAIAAMVPLLNLLAFYVFIRFAGQPRQSP